MLAAWKMGRCFQSAPHVWLNPGRRFDRKQGASRFAAFCCMTWKDLQDLLRGFNGFLHSLSSAACWAAIARRAAMSAAISSFRIDRTRVVSLQLQ